MAICLWMMAGTKEAFGSHVRPKGLPKCTCELKDLGHVPPTKAHHSVKQPIKKMAGHLPHTKLVATQETRGEPETELWLGDLYR